MSQTQDVKYGGYSTVPSDYDCPDGTLSTAINIIPEDNQLKPILPPKDVLSLVAGERIILVHSVPGQKNYIILRNGTTEGSFSLWWLQRDSDPAPSNTSAATKIGDCNGFRDIAIVGNTIVLATDEGIKYSLWKDDAYVSMQDRPPFISIDFGMYKISTLNSAESFDIPATCRPSWSAKRGKAENTELAEFTQMVYGHLLPHVTDVVKDGNFYQPFFVRYAFRLYDGTYSWQSVPILMLPTILPPLIKYTDDGSAPAAGDTLTATFTLNVPYFGLAYRILKDGLSELADWSDIVAGIDIFISAPLYTYDQSKDLAWRPVTTTRNILYSVSNDKTWYNGDRGRPGWTIAESVFVGHYADSLTGSYIDHTMKTGNIDNATDYYTCINIRPHPEFHNNVAKEHIFYKVAELDIKDIKEMTAMARLPLKDEDLTSLVARPTLPDDYQSHNKRIASSLFSYNARLNLAGVEMALAEPFPMRSIMQYGNPTGTAVSTARITVWTRLNGVRCYTIHQGVATKDADKWETPASNFPRYIFYPDASAYKMEIYISDTQKYIINLVPHDHLNGAIWYLGKDGMNKVSTPATNAEAETTSGLKTSVSVGSKVYTSEANNPFVFPLLGINTIDTGEILALSSVVKALSQGQFGQFPLYAFTTEGVWAMEVAANGGFTSRQPVTRDVCINAEAITQIDSAVLFPTDRGIMLIQGSQTQCISESINCETPFDVTRLPQVDKLHSIIHETADACIPVVPFTEFLRHCRMIYDYVHQRIIVYCAENVTYQGKTFRPTYAYVYSLKSQLWGMMKSDIVSNINSYPEALAVNTANQLVDFSTSDVHKAECLIITRPIKLGAGDVLKTIDTLIQRGTFAKGHVMTALYGSRDLINWQLVWTSKDHYLRGFSGTPYKYFRLAAPCFLDEGESLSGASVAFNPKYHMKLR